MSRGRVWDPKNPVAPFTPDGSLLSYPESVYRAGVWVEPEWLPVAPFAATLRLKGVERGVSSVTFVWRDAAGRLFPMFATDVADLMVHGRVENGQTRGQWTVAKRGRNYGIRLVAAL